ncbi:PqiC family protein [Rhodovibrio salinarum]|uniref:ABC-type transport auxiliary lipoprotein component domain-containing protein n=1 Tax=Rhodovibrio salinarum TaxID=1087 RepID=A0A934QLA8_9PROT|nr:PqiC family protein [Rhodovibrio salinarum]MBK1698809.1 hypothetical protein [Rhodovibrio salinarum]
MMIRAARTLAFALVTGLSLSACGLPQESAPTYYYVLDPIDPAAERQAGGAVRLALDTVEIPSYLDRQSLVTRGPNNRLEVSSFHQWGEPLNANVTRVLGENLRLLLDQTDVVRLPNRNGGFNAELQVDIVRFEREADGPVTLAARWMILDGQRHKTLASQRAVVMEPVESSRPAATVAAMDRALATLSRRIAEHLREAGVAT